MSGRRVHLCHRCWLTSCCFFPQPTKATESERILLAVPKKGRLYDRVVELLHGAGLDFARKNRLDIAACTRAPVTLVFLPAADIAQYVGEGDVDMGITGQDIVGEAGVTIETLSTLPLGQCRLSVQTPRGKYKDPRQLAGKRIVTSFPNLARQYFAKFDRELGVQTSIRYVSGSVEAACNLGLADGIVDLVETGTTMHAAGLEAIADIMTTETVLIANPKRMSSRHATLIKLVHQRLTGYITAQRSCMISYNISREKLVDAIKITPGHDSPTITPLEDARYVSVSALVKKSDVAEIMDRLHAIGATSILQFDIANCRF